MALLDIAPPTKEEIIDSFILKMKTDFNTLLQSMIFVWNTNMDRVWDNNQFTPEEFFARLGPDAVSACILSELLKGTVNAAAPGILTKEPTHNIIPNQDGTVTLTEKEESPP